MINLYSIDECETIDQAGRLIGRVNRRKGFLDGVLRGCFLGGLAGVAGTLLAVNYIIPSFFEPSKTQIPQAREEQKQVYSPSNNFQHAFTLNSSDSNLTSDELNIGEDFLKRLHQDTD